MRVGVCMSKNISMSMPISADMSLIANLNEFPYEYSSYKLTFL